jgi:predicted nucleic acid-binding protein
MSSRVQQVIISSPSVTLSELAQAEFFAALSLRLRLGDLQRTTAEKIAELFLQHLDSGLYVSLHLHADVYRMARTFIARFDLPLKAPDALHLAAASLTGLQLVTADRQLARNAVTLGIDMDLLEA